MVYDPEWQAWQGFVEQFRKTLPDEDLNDPKWTPMVKAIEFWAEELVRLRLRQTEDQREAAWQDKKIALQEAVSS